MRRLVAAGVAVGSLAAGVLWSRRKDAERREQWVRRASEVADELAEGVTRTAATAAVGVADAAEKAAGGVGRSPMRPPPRQRPQVPP